MNYELTIIRYGEVALKGKETRRRFEDTLVSNIKNAFDSENLTIKISKEWGRIFVHTSQTNRCVKLLKKIFGITSISPATQTSSDLNSVSKLAVDISKNELNKNKSFAIRATRTGKHNFSSQDVAIKIGDEIVKATNASVDLTNPDFELFIEIRNEKAYLFTEKIYCVGGMPLGTQGKSLALIDSLESILAAWYLMRRGCKAIFLTIGESKNDILKSFMGNWFVKSEIFTNNSKNKLYDEIIKISKDMKCDAVVTGYTLGKSKKIISDLKQLKRGTNLPILHPLIAMEKDEIIIKCKEIGLPI